MLGEKTGVEQLRLKQPIRAVFVLHRNYLTTVKLRDIILTVVKKGLFIVNILKTIISNGFLLLIPIFLWNVAFAKKLPPSFGKEAMDNGMPKYILMGENVLRMIVFIAPLLFITDISTKVGGIGFAVYIIGLTVYFASWLAVIYRPKSVWSKSIFGYAAPAYTTAIWFLGICLMTKTYHFGIPYQRWHYMAASILFIGVHTLHSLIAYKTKIGDCHGTETK